MTTAEPLKIGIADFDIATHDAVLTLVSPRTGDHRTFRIRSVRKGKLAGKRIVELLTGPENTADYTGFAFIDEFGIISVWAKHRGSPGDPSLYERYADLLQRADYWAARGVEFMASLRCRRCGHPLTHPDSLISGYGPKCIKKVGL